MGKISKEAYLEIVYRLLRNDFLTFKRLYSMKPELGRKVLRKLFQIGEYKNVAMSAAKTLGLMPRDVDGEPAKHGENQAIVEGKP